LSLSEQDYEKMLTGSIIEQNGKKLSLDTNGNLQVQASDGTQIELPINASNAFTGFGDGVTLAS
jgi:hypothetical protein